MFVVISQSGVPLGTFQNLTDAQAFRNTGWGTWGATVWQVPTNPNPQSGPTTATPIPNRGR